MTIQKILGEHGPQSQLCNAGACPAAIITDDSNAYVQGYTLGRDEQTKLTAPHGEGFVRIPLDTLKKIAVQVVDA